MTQLISEDIVQPRNGYPTSDGKPMAETDWHRELMTDLIETLKARFAECSDVYVSGNLLVFYEPGNKRRHLAPDVFVVKGVTNKPRPNYLLWEEGKGPDIVIELTSSSTKREDTNKKLKLYRDTLRVREYFLFDPLGDYLRPSLRGYRLEEGQYVSIEMVDNRLRSEVLELNLERDGVDLRFYDPAARDRLPTPGEARSEAAAWKLRAREAETASLRAETFALEIEAARLRAEIEVERLRRELESLRQPKPE